MAGFGRFGQTQKEVLQALHEAGDVLYAILISGPSARALGKNLTKLRRERSRKSIYKSIEALKQRKLVQVTMQDGEKHMRLTQKGKNLVPKYAFPEMKLPHGQAWDGRWHIVIFDIPEKQGKARRAISHQIEHIGALRLQDSVFIYPFPWNEEINSLSRFYRVRSHVWYLEAHIQGDKELRKHFRL